MSFTNQSLLDTKYLSTKDISGFFLQVDRLKEWVKKTGSFVDPAVSEKSPVRVIGFLFFEPSTRTRMSFDMAANRLGFRSLSLELLRGSSLCKGETQVDTVLNLAAMGPDLLIVRYGESPGLDQLLPGLDCPVISAGTGASAHPTQALLDAYTIEREVGISGQKVLLVGDIRHSRVARSNFDVLNKLGAEIGICGPPELLLDDKEFSTSKIKVFEDLDKGINWATVYMGLRLQVERNEGSEAHWKSGTEFHSRYGLCVKRLQRLSDRAIILHPGPIHYGVEFCDEVYRDPRNRVLKQVSNGVFVRAALLSLILGNHVGH